MTGPATEQWQTLNEVAPVLRVNRQTLLREIERGNLTATKIGGRWLLSDADIEAYVKAGYNLVREKPKPPRAG